STANSHNQWKADFSKRGGHLLWFTNQRDVAQKKLSITEAQAKAEQFLKSHGYDQMQAVSYDEYQNISNFMMARVDGDVVIYPDQLSIKVALDNGEVIGLNAAQFVYSSANKRQVGKPELTAEQAKSHLNKNF